MRNINGHTENPIIAAGPPIGRRNLVRDSDAAIGWRWDSDGRLFRFNSPTDTPQLILDPSASADSPPLFRITTRGVPAATQRESCKRTWKGD